MTRDDEMGSGADTVSRWGEAMWGDAFVAEEEDAHVPSDASDGEGDVPAEVGDDSSHDQAPSQEQEATHQPFGPNVVRLVGHYGGDILHAVGMNADQLGEQVHDISAAAPDLIRANIDRNEHLNFTRSHLQFLVTADVLTYVGASDAFDGLGTRHDVSLRGPELGLGGQHFYAPDDWPDDERNLYMDVVAGSYRAFLQVVNASTTRGMPAHIAARRAALMLPCASQVTFDILMDWSTFDRFMHSCYSYSVRLEVRQVASGMLQVVKRLGSFDASLQAFGYLDEEGAVRGPFGALNTRNVR